MQEACQRLQVQAHLHGSAISRWSEIGIWNWW